MKLDGTRSFAAPREAVWEVLNSPDRMAAVMPGVESFDVRDDRHWRANVKIPLGLGGLRMAIDFERMEERTLEYARLRAKGTGVGALMDLETQFHLEEQGGGTSMRWEADVRIAGPVGGMGQRVLQPIVNQQVQHVLAALDREVSQAAAAQASGTAAEQGPSAAGGSQPAPPPEPATRAEAPFVAAAEETPPGQEPPVAEEPARWGEASSSQMGTLGTPEPTTDLPPPETDPELKDAGPPAEGGSEAEPAAVEGSSGADEGLSPWEPGSYGDEARPGPDDADRR